MAASAITCKYRAPVTTVLGGDPHRARGGGLFGAVFFHGDARPHALVGAEDGSARAERHPVAGSQLDYRRASGSLSNASGGTLRQIAVDHDAGDFSGQGAARGAGHITAWSDHRQRHHAARRSRLNEIGNNRP
jgi:hypothetical protein